MSESENEPQVGITGSMSRQPTLQTITWLLNLRKYGQLDLDPPYQRRSVWSLREKQRFIDTVIRNYPSPAIFLHVDYDNEGNTTYHVVDGKQRLSTILAFADNLLRLPKDFGDTRVAGANWRGLEQFPQMRRAFWGYQLTVEQIDDVQEPVVREIFERLNRNSRKLESQEMRHARFDGWLISYLEVQADGADRWKRIRLATPARARRMQDVQILTELAQVLIERRPMGFDQNALDELCALYEDPADSVPDFDQDDFVRLFEEKGDFLADVESADSVVTEFARSLNHLYPLWAVAALDGHNVGPAEFAGAYRRFMTQVDAIRLADTQDPLRDRSAEDPLATAYLNSSKGATTEYPQRQARYQALSDWLRREL